MNDERREERTDLVVKKSALEVMETSFLLCFAHPARIHNPKMHFFPLLLPHGFLIQSKEVLCFQIPSLLPSFAPFYKPILVVLNILPALCHNSLRRELCLIKALWECSWGVVSPKFLNNTPVMEYFKGSILLCCYRISTPKSFTPNTWGNINTLW